VSERAIRVAWLYPELMNVYADRGNVIALRARCAAHGLGCEVEGVELGTALPAEADLVLIGGGQDREQRRAAPDLRRHAPRLLEWAAEGVAFLAVCGGFQLFGTGYRTARGEELPGVGLFDVTTVAPPPGAERCVGDVLADTELDGVGEVVGFENHAGRTYLGPGARPFARVRYGWGNNGVDGTEGAVAGEAIGTYLHGSLLPRHPWLSDRLIGSALRHRYGQDAELEALPAEGFAARAHRAAAAVARRRGRPTAS
jgi:CobQ-like glutamine amidotransferase family enzyme